MCDDEQAFGLEQVHHFVPFFRWEVCSEANQGGRSRFFEEDRGFGSHFQCGSCCVFFAECFVCGFGVCEVCESEEQFAVFESEFVVGFLSVEVFQRVVGIVFSLFVDDPCHELKGKGRVNAVAASVSKSFEPAEGS